MELGGRALVQDAPGPGFHPQHHGTSPALPLALLAPITQPDSGGPQYFLMERQRAEWK